MLQQLYRYMRLLSSLLVAHFLLVVDFLPFAIFAHLLVRLGTGAFVWLELLGP